MFGIFRRLLESLLKTGLSLMKIVLKSLGKTFSILLRINSSSNNNRCNYSKEEFWTRYHYTDNLKGRSEWYHESN